MDLTPTSVMSPPLRLLWKVTTPLLAALPGNESLYGVTPEGRLVALNASDGSQRWQAIATYHPGKVARQGRRLFTYRSDGFGFVDDADSNPVEILALSFGTVGANLSMPVVDERMVYLAVNQGLYAFHQDEGLKFGTVLSEQMPCNLTPLSGREFLLIDGRGVPTRYRAGESAFEVVWRGESHGLSAGLSERPFLVTDNRFIVGVSNDTIAYDLRTGRIAWHLTNVPGRAFAASNGVVYVAFHGASLWAVTLDSGRRLWQRQYIYDVGLQREYSLALSGNYLYFGGILQRNPDQSILLAVQASDGQFSWLSRAASAQWGAGIPAVDDSHLFVHNPTYTAAYAPLAGAPSVSQGNIGITPSPLRGPRSAFGSGVLTINLPVAAQVSAVLYREAQGLGTVLVNRANWGAGPHSVSWSPNAAGGYQDNTQFGYVLVDITESGLPTYSQALLLPVNTFPDILWHWARAPVETMIYHKYLSGYPDQLFKPDNFVTRAESTTILAKTIGRETPSPSFQTKFSDIATHWARPYIMALEEAGVIGGFQEADGTFTFRPDLNMTRAQEARVLVQAYGIAPAPNGFASRFTDIGGHWASADIKALEAAGYINGYQESDGTFTYRPEQPVSRAELSAIIVRIRGLTR